MALEDLTEKEWALIDEHLDHLLELAFPARMAALRKLDQEDADLAGKLRTILDDRDSPLNRPAAAAMADLVDCGTKKFQDPALGSCIGPYRLVKQLGVGGMGVVYLAERSDGHFEQKVALKVIRDGVRDEATKRRFLTERQILAELQHPNIARLLDGGVDENGRPFLAMEYVDGVPLDEYCQRERLDLKQRLELFLDVCAAIEAAHHNLIVHRDLKPGNILVDGPGTVKVLDFGIAKWLDESRAAQFGSLTINDAAPLTPDTSAPEQLTGAAVTTATDVYALGLLLYRLLTDKRPFNLTGLALTERVRCLTEAEAPRPSEVVPGDRGHRLRGDLDHIVAKALRKDPTRRYQDARALAEDISRHLARRPVLASPDSAGYRLGKFIRRNAALVALAGIAITALVVGLVVSTRQARIAQRERTQAVKQAERAERIADSLVRVFEDSDPYSGAGRVPTALDILDANVERMRSEFAAEPELQADLLLMMARAYKGLGHTEPVGALLDEAQVVRDSLFGPNSYESAEVRLQRVGWLRRRGDLAAAQQEMSGLIAIYEAHTAPDAPERIGIYEAASTLALQSEQFALADSLSTMVLTLRRRLYGENSPNIATSYTHRAVILDILGRRDESRNLYERAIEIFRAHPAQRHNLSGTLGNYALLLENMGLMSEALDAQRESIRLAREIGMRSGDVLANQLNTLGALLNELGRYEESIPVLREAAAMNEEAGGRTSIRWLAVAMTLGTALTYANEYEEAAEWLDAGVAGMGELVGTDHLYYGVALSYRGILDRQADRPNQARRKLERALTLLRPALPNRAHNTVSVLTELGEMALATGQRDSAAAYLGEAVRIADESLPEIDSFRCRAMAGLGELRRQEGDRVAAAKLLRAAVAGLTERRGADDDWTRLAAERLAQCSAER